MPEASVHRDDGPVAWEHDVGATGKVFAVETKAKPESVGNPANNQLRLGVSTPDA